jgi:hypothetical protein
MTVTLMTAACAAAAAPHRAHHTPWYNASGLASWVAAAG